jgi:hypothetical protein
MIIVVPRIPSHFFALTLIRLMAPNEAAGARA